MHWSMVSSTPLGDWPSLFFAEEIFVWLKLYLWETANTVGIGWLVGGNSEVCRICFSPACPEAVP